MNMKSTSDESTPRMNASGNTGRKHVRNPYLKQKPKQQQQQQQQLNHATNDVSHVYALNPVQTHELKDKDTFPAYDVVSERNSEQRNPLERMESNFKNGNATQQINILSSAGETKASANGEFINVKMRSTRTVKNPYEVKQIAKSAVSTANGDGDGDGDRSLSDKEQQQHQIQHQPLLVDHSSNRSRAYNPYAKKMCHDENCGTLKLGRNPIQSIQRHDNASTHIKKTDVNAKASGVRSYQNVGNSNVPVSTTRRIITNPYKKRIHAGLLRDTQAKPNFPEVKASPSVTVSSPISLNPYKVGSQRDNNRTSKRHQQQQHPHHQQNKHESHQMASSSPNNPYTQKQMKCPQNESMHSPAIINKSNATCSTSAHIRNATQDVKVAGTRPGNYDTGTSTRAHTIPIPIRHDTNFTSPTSKITQQYGTNESKPLLPNEPVNPCNTTNNVKRTQTSKQSDSATGSENKNYCTNNDNSKLSLNLCPPQGSLSPYKQSRSNLSECTRVDAKNTANSKIRIQNHENISLSQNNIPNPYKRQRQCLQSSESSIRSNEPLKNTANKTANTTRATLTVKHVASSSQKDPPVNHQPPRKALPTGPRLPKLPPELEYDTSRLKHINDEHRLKLIKAAELGGTLKNGWKLLSHQKVGVLKAIQMRRYVLAYDMGLGKTLIGCVWAKAFKNTFPNLKVYIIAPVSLKKEWNRTATDIVGLKCEEEKGAKAKLDQNSLDIRISSWAKVPLRVPTHIEKYIVICDEAHNLQSMESARTKDTLKLVRAERCAGVLLLTGTPMKNGKPSNLFPLLRASRHPFGDNQKMYEVFFCNGQLKNFRGKEVFDASGSSNLNLLNAHIASHVLYKTKEECLKDLPGKTREYKIVPVGSRFEIQHNRAINDLANIYKAMSTSTGDSGNNEAILGAFARLRQVAAFAKIDATVAIAKSILEEEPSIVIFSYFVAVAKEVHRKLEHVGWKGEILAGETPSAKRQDMVDRFQDGVSPVFIATFGAGGVGITLTAARTIILMDRPWTPGDALQAEDRVRRIGQTKSVRSIWMRAFDIDKQIDELIEHKNQNTNAVVGAKNVASSQSNVNKAAPKISIRQLIHAIVAKKDSKEAG